MPRTRNCTGKNRENQQFFNGLLRSLGKAKHIKKALRMLKNGKAAKYVDAQKYG